MSQLARVPPVIAAEREGVTDTDAPVEITERRLAQCNGRADLTAE
jgi:hypothetical protein